MVDIKAALLDDVYREISLSEIASRVVDSMALKKTTKKTNPILLKPTMAVEVRASEEYMSDIIGNLNSRRGQIPSMDRQHGVRVVKAQILLSEVLGYIGDLRSKTQGRTVYSMEFDSYTEVPCAIADEIAGKPRGN